MADEGLQLHMVFTILCVGFMHVEGDAGGTFVLLVGSRLSD